MKRTKEERERERVQFMSMNSKNKSTKLKMCQPSKRLFTAHGTRLKLILKSRESLMNFKFKFLTVPYWYTRIIKNFHTNVCHIGPDSKSREPVQMDFLFFRCVSDPQPGWKSRQLIHLGLVPGMMVPLLGSWIQTKLYVLFTSFRHSIGVASPPSTFLNPQLLVILTIQIMIGIYIISECMSYLFI